MPKQEMPKGQLAGMKLSRESEERETAGRRQSVERSGQKERLTDYWICTEVGIFSRTA